MKPETMEYGTQPLDAVMSENGLTNHDLVKLSGEQLSHKVVQKGRRGRRLTLNAKMKILRAVQKALPDRSWAAGDLFNYRDE